MHDKLMEFFEKHYSAEKISAAFFGNLKMRELEYIANKYLIQIPVRNAEPLYLDDVGLTDQEEHELNDNFDAISDFEE